MLRQYIRNQNNQVIGLMLADIIDGNVRIGISRCHKKDRFNKELADKIALARMQFEEHHNGISDMTALAAPFVSEQIDRFNDRVKRYFKTNQGE